MVPEAWGWGESGVTQRAPGAQAPRLTLYPEVRPSPQLWPHYKDTGLLPVEQAAVPGSCMTLGSVTDTT